MFWPRGMGLGGSTNLNNQIYQRGNPKDYDSWANITGNKEWAYDNVLNYFKKLEDYSGVYPNDEFHGRHGPMKIEKARQTYMSEYFLKAAKEKGFKIQDPNARQTEGFGEIELSSYDGTRWGTYKGYIEPLLSRDNLKIYRFARVAKVFINQQNHAYGLSYYRFGVKKYVRARKEIILSAGALDTPKILMLSGIGPKRHLESVGIQCKQNLPVGRNLQDHVYSLFGPFLVDTNESLVVNESDLSIFTKYVKDGTGHYGSINGLSAVGFVTTAANKDKSWPDMQFFMSGLGVSRALESTIFNRLFNIREDVMKEYLRPYDGHHANFVLTVLVRPESKGQIRLANSNPFTKPLIQPNYFKEKKDIKAMVGGMKFIMDLYENTTTYKAINARLVPNLLPGCQHFRPKSDAYFECFARHFTMTIYHPVGTARMGKDMSDPLAVVDSELRVLNVTGLRVIDASIMPNIVNANTNFPSIMIGEIGADFILRQYGEKSKKRKRVCSIREQIQLPMNKDCISILDNK